MSLRNKNIMINITQDILKNIYKIRSPEVRKYDYGLLLVIGGSEFYSGSPALSGLAAFKSGVDMVQIIAPKRAADIIASFSPNLAAYPLEGNWLTRKHLATLVTMTESASIVSRGNAAVVIGGGAGRTEETQETILEYLSQVSLPVVVDADAIYAVAKEPKIFSGKNFLFTPHRHEFFILTGKEIMNLTEEERIKMVEAEAGRLQTTILLKGKTDVISDGKETALNSEGSNLMSKGGTGDTLAGIAGALLARRINCFEAGSAAAFINGKAGRLAGEKFGEGLLATDLIEKIPEVLS
jgi:NAD(P)H-hydrate epimerase